MEDVKLDFSRLAPLAAQTLVQLVQSAEHERVRLEAARLILEFGGYAPAQKHQIEVSRHESHARNVQEAWRRRAQRLEAKDASKRVDEQQAAPETARTPRSPVDSGKKSSSD